MSYLDSYLLTMNSAFRGRVSACVAEQAKVFVNDERPEYVNLAHSAIAANDPITDQFMPLISTQPDMSQDSDDGAILAAVQALWPTIGAGSVD
jgi:hypothetical protein